MITFGERAFPLVMGDGDSDLLMAAAEYGTGRVFAIQNDNYFFGFIGKQHL